MRMNHSDRDNGDWVVLEGEAQVVLDFHEVTGALCDRYPDRINWKTMSRIGNPDELTGRHPRDVMRIRLNAFQWPVFRAIALIGGYWRRGASSRAKESTLRNIAKRMPYGGNADSQKLEEIMSPCLYECIVYLQMERAGLSGDLTIGDGTADIDLTENHGVLVDCKDNRDPSDPDDSLDAAVKRFKNSFFTKHEEIESKYDPRGEFGHLVVVDLSKRDFDWIEREPRKFREAFAKFVKTDVRGYAVIVSGYDFGELGSEGDSVDWRQRWSQPLLIPRVLADRRVHDVLCAFYDSIGGNYPDDVLIVDS